MNKVFLFLFIVTFSITRSYSQTTYTLDSTQLQATIIVDSALLSAPWDIDWGFDNRLWISDVNNILAWDTTTKALKTLYTMPKGNALGLCVPDKMPQSSKIYIYAVYDTGLYYSQSNWAQLFRFEYDSQKDTLINRKLILEYEHHGEHSGGRIVIGKDEKIYLTTADYTYVDTLHQKLGKVLRINTDGTVPNDNYKADHTFTFGHRNPQGMVCLPNGEIFISEHGQIENEINHLKEGRNYGWYAFDAFNCTNLIADSCNSPTFIANHEFPVVDLGWRFPPAGMDYYGHPNIPEFENSIITGILYPGDSINVAKLNVKQDSIVSHKSYALKGNGRIRDICVNPSGEIFMIVRDRFRLNTSGTVQSDAYIIKVKNPKYNVSIKNVEAKNNIEVYPNPAKDKLYINYFLDPITHNTEYTLTDMLGKVYANGTIKKKTTILDTKQLTPGIYLLKIKERNSISTIKITIQ